MIERGHRDIENALTKLCDGNDSQWVKHLHSVLWADRVTTKKTTGHSPYYLLYGMDPLLPVDLAYPTWNVLPWPDVYTTADLLAMRARHLERRDEDLEEATFRLERHRENAAESWDERHTVTDRTFQIGEMVLLHDTQLKFSHSAKLRYRWIGPYRIAEAYPEKGSYRIAELNGALKKRAVASDRLKPFLIRNYHNATQSDIPWPGDLTPAIVPESAEFSASNGTAPAVLISEDEYWVQDMERMFVDDLQRWHERNLENAERIDETDTSIVERDDDEIEQHGEDHSSDGHEEEPNIQPNIQPSIQLSRLRPRPMKPLTLADETTITQHIQHHQTGPRKRGRPRKIRIPTTPPLHERIAEAPNPASLNDGTIVKRGRGRPRKNL
ncbi:hypothetical protein AA313_de0203932 [Arthrobotrys entomopaga]|nr:hypothetical protein AA313_de0203932 [Arthrobotrys entomopaga]